MTTAPIKLSTTGRAMLTLAATRGDRLVRPPELPVAAARQVIRSLLNNGLVEEVPAPTYDPACVWREAGDGTKLALRATDHGLAATGETADAPPPVHGEESPGDGTPTVPIAAADETAARDAIQDTEVTHDKPTAATRAPLLRAARAFLDAWGDEANCGTDIISALQAPMASLRAALAGAMPRIPTGAPRKPREGLLHRLPDRRGALIRSAGGNTSRHAVALYRVSTAEQGHSGLGLEARRTSVRASTAVQGWTLAAEFSDTSRAARTTAVPASRQR